MEYVEFAFVRKIILFCYSVLVCGLKRTSLTYLNKAIEIAFEEEYVVGDPKKNILKGNSLI